MARVEVQVVDAQVTNDSGRQVHGVVMTCPRCGVSVTCPGRLQRSVKRCFVLLKDECEDEDGPHFYVDPDIDDRPG